MKSLRDSVKDMASQSMRNGNSVSFLDHSLQDKKCQSIIRMMNSVNLKSLGVQGEDSASDTYHFQKKLNRVTIDGNDDYRLVLFFIKKGMVMPLHDHPNMSVYFKLMFGKLKYCSYDKLEEKYKYNNFSNDEYIELLETKKEITAKKSNIKILDKKNLLLVRPSCGNMHQFVAEEDSCFFDICLPNYTADSLRRITYFNEISHNINDQHNDRKQDDDEVCRETAAINNNISYEQDKITKAKNITTLQYDTTPPVMPIGMEIAELDYIGEMQEAKKYF